MDFMDLMDKLSEEQRNNAILVATAAAKAGVDPTLAVAIAYQESRLNPNVGRGSSGEIGMMQIMPSTGKGMGYDEKALADPQKNIEAGINYLKRALLATDNDPKLAAVFYNGGPNALELLRAGKEPDPRVINYVKSLDSYGTFAQAPQGQPSQDGSSQTESVERDPNLPPPAETDDELVGIMNDMRLEAQMLSDAEAQEKRQAQIYGAGAGAGVSAGKLAGTGVGAALEGAGRRLAEGMASVTGNRAPTAPTTTGPLTSGEKWHNATGYGRGAGTVQDVSSRYQRSVGKGKVTGRMDKLWGVPQPDESPQLSQRLIDRANAANAARAAATAAPSGLDTVSRMFAGMMRPVAAVANTGLKYLAPPLALASAAGEGVNIAQQLRRDPASPLDVLGQNMVEPEKSRDYTSMGLSGLNILGGAMSLFPGTAAVGIPLSAGTAAYQAYRDDPKILEKMRQKIFSSDYPEQMVAP